MTATTIERRQITTDIELRSAGDGRTIIEGYSPVYERLSEDLGGFVEIVERGAAKRRLGDDIFGLFNHDSALVLGRSTAGTMRLGEDETGVHFEIDVPDTTLGRDLTVSMERGDITGSSFSFSVLEDELDVTEAGYPLRRIKSFRQLFDIGPVTYPAYPDADAGLGRRSLVLGQHADELGRSASELVELPSDELVELIRAHRAGELDHDRGAISLSLNIDGRTIADAMTSSASVSIDQGSPGSFTPGGTLPPVTRDDDRESEDRTGDTGPDLTTTIERRLRLAESAVL